MYRSTFFATILISMVALFIPNFSQAGDLQPEASSEDVADVSQGPDSAMFNPSLAMEDYSIAGEKHVSYGSPTTFLEWHGYINFEFDDKQGTNSNFDLHEFYLAAQANISEKLSVIAEFEYEHAPEKLILPINAYATYAAAPYLNIRAGLFFVPVGIPVAYTLRGNKNRMIRQVALKHDITWENWSEAGIEVFGEVPLSDMGLPCDRVAWWYDVAIGNGVRTIGNGDSWFDAVFTLQDHTEDHNNNKMLAGRTGFSFSDYAGWNGNVGVSYATQKYDVGVNSRLTHLGTDVRLQHTSGARLQAEWLRRRGKDQVCVFPACAGVPATLTADADAWYVQVSHRMLEGAAKYMNYLEPAFQVDAIEQNTGRSAVLTVAPAIVYSPLPFLQLKFEYDFVLEHTSSGYERGATKNDTLWLAMVAEF